MYTRNWKTVSLTRQRVRRRPGTVAIAGAIQNKYDIPVIPHVICSGATKEDIEYELLDLQFRASAISLFCEETRRRKTDSLHQPKTVIPMPPTSEAGKPV